jgi:hypothetical protein
MVGTMQRRQDQIRDKHQRPANREHYFLVLANGEIKNFPWNDTVFDYEVWDFGNCFRMRQEAEQARDSIKKLLHQSFFEELGNSPVIDKEKLKEEIKMRLRYILPYYVREDKDDCFYLVRDEDITRAAENLADLFHKVM